MRTFAAAILIALVPVRGYAQCPDGSPPPCRSASGRAGAPPPVTVAVLPFDNLSRDSGDAYLASGLTDEITTRLQEIDRLTVTSATFMRRYRGADDPRRVATEMRVANLVAGSVRRDQRRLRVSVELINARTGVALWRNAYNQPDTMLLDIQADIAAKVATAITGQLLPEERARIDTRARRDPRAYDLFLRGNYDLGLRTPRSLARAAQSYAAAARIDTSYAAALAMLSNAYSLLSSTYYDGSLGISRDSLRELSRLTAMRALRADSTAPEALVAAGFWAGPREQRAYLERAVALDPRNASVLYAYANLLAGLGEDAASRDYLRRAIAIDPRQSIILLSLGMGFLRDRNYAEAVRWLDSAVSFGPEAYYFYSDRGIARLHTGDTAGVRADADQARRLGNPLTADVLLALLALSRGDTASPRLTAAALAGPIARADCVRSFDCVTLAMLQAALGDADAAIALLSRAQGTGRGGWMAGWLYHAEFDPIRRDPRFQAIMARASL